MTINGGSHSSRQAWGWGSSWEFTSWSTSLPARLYLLIISKQSHLLGINYSTTWTYWGHSHSNHYINWPINSLSALCLTCQWVYSSYWVSSKEQLLSRITLEGFLLLLFVCWLVGFVLFSWKGNSNKTQEEKGKKRGRKPLKDVTGWVTMRSWKSKQTGSKTESWSISPSILTCHEPVLKQRGMGTWGRMISKLCMWHP